MDLSKKRNRFGIIGAVVGFLVGASIPSHVGVGISFLQRITGNIIVEDPQGLVVSFGYAVLGATLMGALGAIIGGMIEKEQYGFRHSFR